MPSGAKKRKAAKKKKEKQASGNNSNKNDQSRGNEQDKSLDDRDSDAGEVSSPVSEDHHPLKNGSEEVNNREPSSVPSSDDEKKHGPQDVQQEGVEDEGSIQIINLTKSEAEGSDCNEVSIEHVEPTKESPDKEDRSSSSSSSDGESQVAERESKEEISNFISGSTAVDETVNVVESLSNEVSSLTEKPSSAEVHNSALDSSSLVDSDKQVVYASEELIHPSGNDSLDNLTAPSAVKSDLKENGQILSPVLGEVNGVHLAGTGSASSKIEDKELQLQGGNAEASSNVVINTSQPSSGDSRTRTRTVAEDNSKDSEVPACSEKQPLVAPVPRVEQRTSCFSCCGLLDVITGSSR